MLNSCERLQHTSEQSCEQTVVRGKLALSPLAITNTQHAHTRTSLKRHMKWPLLTRKIYDMIVLSQKVFTTIQKSQKT